MGDPAAVETEDTYMLNADNITLLYSQEPIFLPSKHIMKLKLKLVNFRV